MTNKSDLKRLDLFFSKKPAETLNRFFLFEEQQQLQLQCRKTKTEKLQFNRLLNLALKLVAKPYLVDNAKWFYLRS